MQRQVSQDILGGVMGLSVWGRSASPTRAGATLGAATSLLGGTLLVSILTVKQTKGCLQNAHNRNAMSTS